MIVMDLTTEELDLLDDLCETEIDVVEATLNHDIGHESDEDIDAFLERTADYHERINALQVVRAKLKEMRESGGDSNL